MDNLTSNWKDGGKELKNRFKGKLFKEKKADHHQDGEQDVNTFLRGSSDKLYMMPTADNPAQTPTLTRIDTNSARRWPTAAEVNNVGTRRHSTNQRRGRKGLVVRFTDAQPEVIGEGGDESTVPVVDIGRRRAQSHPPAGRPVDSQQDVSNRRMYSNQDYGRVGHAVQKDDSHALFHQPPAGIPGTLAISNPVEIDEQSRPRTVEGDSFAVAQEVTNAAPQSSGTPSMDLKAEMQAAEGRALLEAASRPSTIDQHFPHPESSLPDSIEISSELNELHMNTVNNTVIPPPLQPTPPPSQFQQHMSQQSIVQLPQTPDSTIQLQTSSLSSRSAHPPPTPPGIPAQLAPGHGLPQATPSERPQNVSRTTSNLTMQEAAIAVGNDALREFSRRSAHLYTLFRLAAESVRPLPKCSPQQLVRVALWWFLKGRSNLERSIRERSTDPKMQQENMIRRQQAHADLAKGLWIIEAVTSQHPQRQTVSDGPNSPMADLLSSQQNIISGLKKISISMKRNNLMPPEPDDAPLPQGLDHTIWVADEGNRSLVQSQRFSSTFSLSESFALGDSARHFYYGRLFAEAAILEESASQYYRCHVLLSIIREQNEKNLTVTIASQDGLFNIGIQNDRARGPTWDDVNWELETRTLEITLPRGFLLRLHCHENDFEAMLELYDMHKEIYALLDQRPQEVLVFDAGVRSFQQFNLDSEVPPKDPLSNCHMRLFEKTISDSGPNGQRIKHRGFRLALCSNPQTKGVKGVDRMFFPDVPLLFGFLRGVGGLPALQLRSSDEQSEHNIVFTFEDINDRAQLHSLLSGIALKSTEDVVLDVALKSYAVTNQKHYTANCLQYLAWQNLRIINETGGKDHDARALSSNHLRVVLDFKAGTMADRLNLGPGEMKFRLSVKSSTEIQLLRQRQVDMTITVSESQVLKELPSELKELLRHVGKYESTRTYTFPSAVDLHLFQTILTGFKVVFDGIATSLNISRRRMVVPIYKKWDAATTRVQIVQKETVVQLLAFFEDFSHGDCMNFVLKSTDVFESSGRNGKYTIRIVDAKFALPKGRAENDSGDAPFVCLDLPEYPGEHDDISIVFDNENDRERFAQALPAPVRHASRMSSIRR